MRVIFPAPSVLEASRSCYLITAEHNLPFIKEMGSHQLVFLYNIVYHYFPRRYRARSYIAIIIELYLSYDI